MPGNEALAKSRSVPKREKAAVHTEETWVTGAVTPETRSPAAVQGFQACSFLLPVSVFLGSHTEECKCPLPSKRVLT